MQKLRSKVLGISFRRTITQREVPDFGETDERVSKDTRGDAKDVRLKSSRWKKTAFQEIAHEIA